MTNRERALQAALELNRSIGMSHNADGLIKEARKIEAYLEGRDDPAPDAAPVIFPNADQSINISTGSSGKPFQVVGSYTSGDRNI